MGFRACSRVVALRGSIVFIVCVRVFVVIWSSIGVQTAVELCEGVCNSSSGCFHFVFFVSHGRSENLFLPRCDARDFLIPLNSSEILSRFRVSSSFCSPQIPFLMFVAELSFALCFFLSMACLFSLRALRSSSFEPFSFRAVVDVPGLRCIRDRFHSSERQGLTTCLFILLSSLIPSLICLLMYVSCFLCFR